ncbi:MAG TPA: sodium:proton antiporter [Clostridia bacterium]
MKDWIKKQTLASWAVCIGAVLGLVGVIFYIATSTAGYLKGYPMNAAPIVCTFIAVAIAAALLIFADKLDGRLKDLAVLAINVLLIASLMVFILERVALIADVYFIPVNYPAAEETALNISMAGFAFYALAIIANIVSAFNRRFIND